MATGTITTLSTSKRRISPRTMLKCSSERAKRAKLISKSLFGSPSRSELKEHIKAATTNNENRSGSTQWEFDFEMGKPTKVHKNFKWEALCNHEVPKVYTVNHIKRLYATNERGVFEGQLPKLRYYHHIKPREENENKLANQPITAGKKNAGQTKITDFLREKKRLTMSAGKKKQRI
ncbi:unnamed protein product [Diamesa serratosioi]